MTDARYIEFVTERYITTGAWSSVDEIAKAMSVSESTIRRTFSAAACPLRAQRRGVGRHQKWEYAPTVQVLRQMIVKLRQDLALAKNEAHTAVYRALDEALNSGDGSYKP